MTTLICELETLHDILDTLVFEDEPNIFSEDNEVANLYKNNKIVNKHVRYIKSKTNKRKPLKNKTKKKK
jgi:hypothetical protein